MENGGALNVFYRAVGWRKAGGRGEGGGGGGTSISLVTGDGNGEEDTTGCNHFRRGRRRGGSTVWKADGTSKSGAHKKIKCSHRGTQLFRNLLKLNVHDDVGCCC
jgi:hypothetical protein